MPELPEVETIRRGLAPQLAGRRFIRVEVLWPGAVRYPALSELLEQLPGQLVQSVARRGKYLVLRLASGSSLIFHLGMSGRLLLLTEDGESDPYLRARFSLEAGHRLLFCDKRKLGGLWLVPREEVVLGRLGPEPLEPAFTPELLGERLARRSAPLKALLCQQEVLAGLGNIYADEALFQAGLHPLRPGGSLEDKEIQALHRAIQDVLREAIAHQGTTLRDYRTAAGETGSHQEALRVYRREGKPCLACGTPIARIRIRSRSAHFCPHCQAGRGA